MAAKQALAQPPQQWFIPVTKGCDRPFTVRRKDSVGAPVSWEAEVWIDIDIDKTSPTRVAAGVAGDLATIVISNAVCDQVKGATRWRIVMSKDGIETALAVGTFERHDG